METGPIALPELRKVMERNCDTEASIGYWATQKVLWNGREVLVERRNWVSQDED